MRVSQERYADALVLAPVGRIDNSTTDGLRSDLNAYVATCREGGDRLVLDFSKVDYISSVGLRVLMLAAKKVRAGGVDRHRRASAGGAGNLRNQPLQSRIPVLWNGARGFGKSLGGCAGSLRFRPRRLTDGAVGYVLGNARVDSRFPGLRLGAGQACERDSSGFGQEPRHSGKSAGLGRHGARFRGFPYVRR